MVDLTTLGALRRLKAPTLQNLVLASPPPIAGVTLGSFFYESTADNITATASGTQANSYLIVAEVTRVTTVATTGDSILLPSTAAVTNGTPGTGVTLLIINHGANPMTIFGNGTDTVDDVATATGVSQMQGSMVLYTCTSAGKWYTEGLGTGYAGNIQTIGTASYAATGTTQGGGKQLTTQFANVSTGSTNSGVILPASSLGMNITVNNQTAATIKVYPSGATDQIDGAGSTVAVSISSGSRAAQFVCWSTNAWTSYKLGAATS